MLIVAIIFYSAFHEALGISQRIDTAGGSWIFFPLFDRKEPGRGFWDFSPTGESMEATNLSVWHRLSWPKRCKH